jgi:hypothetical protein
MSEAVLCTAGTLQWLSYRYHYQEPSDLVLRYDNAPHHPEVITHPDHKHVGDDVLASSHPTIAQVLLEVQALRDRQREEAVEGQSWQDIYQMHDPVGRC